MVAFILLQYYYYYDDYLLLVASTINTIIPLVKLGQPNTEKHTNHSNHHLLPSL
jgi:hypothetical protein